MNRTDDLDLDLGSAAHVARIAVDRTKDGVTARVDRHADDGARVLIEPVAPAWHVRAAAHARAKERAVKRTVQSRSAVWQSTMEGARGRTCRENERRAVMGSARAEQRIGALGSAL
jgi:hypothetical protein